MTEKRLFSLVMAGGKGTRFWPESTSKKPKQYLSLVEKRSLLEMALDRFEGLVPSDQRYIVTVQEQEKLARTCSDKKIGKDNLIFEPMGRNTAPCILLSLVQLMHRGASLEDVVIIVPADHVILNEKGFRETLQMAARAASKEQTIVTVGIQPHFPHTGYGYIHLGKVFSEGPLYQVEEFKEKPDFERATQYLQNGNYLWNAGMFVSTIAVLLEEMEKCAPEIFQYYSPLYEAKNDQKRIAEIYAKIPANSIDYAVMEKSSSVSILKANFDWNDLGSWDALEAVCVKTEKNILIGNNGHYFSNAENNIIFASSQYVALIDVKDLIIVSNPEALLILPKQKSQEVKNVVKNLQGGPWEKNLL